MMGEWRRGKRDKNKEKEKAEQLAIVRRNMQNQTDQKDRIGQDSTRQWRLGEELTYGHRLWNGVPIYLDTTDCTIQDQQMYSKMYSKEGWATRGHFEDYTPLKKLLV